ncbi:proteinrelated to integral membrane protein pth11 [Metarhizium guizhouense ARSEF 977]|uniref:Proteinrelated to integral membrane protein pth11 n=1 Tax=Metarhizium guizhouense (strain ARSEF 977) TaxID=1276136 RepID=A0A0B4HNH7_METGA|nr:proteinrelated to integral membrane protein pth11 [Metarhizium guizhouense ARSEF 977]
MGDPRIDEAIAAGDVPSNVPIHWLRESRDTSAIAGIVVVLVLTTLVVMLRLYSRKYITKKGALGIDDGIALASLLVFIPFTALCIELLRLGAGRNFLFEWFVMTTEDDYNVQLIDSITHLVYSTTLVLCRVSGLAFYYRICRMNPKFLLAIKIIFVVIILGYVAQLCLIIFHCQPVTLLWAPFSEEDEAKYHCMYWYETYSIISSISLFCDLLLFGIPAIMLKGLELPRKQKLQLAYTLFPGILVIGISAGRVVLVTKYGNETDETFEYAFLNLLCVEVAEVGATIIAVSIPGVKPLVDKYILLKDKDSNSSSSKSRGSSISSTEEIKQHRGHVDIMEFSEEKFGRWPRRQTEGGTA